MASSEEIKKILSLPGEVRGDVLNTDLAYLKRVLGNKKTEEFKKRWEKAAGFYFKEIKNVRWYPIGYKILILAFLKKYYHWLDNDFIKMGQSAYQHSFIVKTILKYFVSLEKTFKETPKFWSKYWNAGEFIPYKMDLNKKYLIIRLKDFKIHPDLCLYFLGHFKAIANLILNTPTLRIDETKCVFRGDHYHEFVIKW